MGKRIRSRIFNRIKLSIYILYSFRKTVKDITIEEGKKDKVIEQEVATLFIY